MMQLLTTQIVNHFHKIKNEEEFQIEDAARSLCNTIIGDGYIYWYGVKNMSVLADEAVEGADPFPKSKRFDQDPALSSLDRVIILCASTDDEEASRVFEHAKSEGAEVVVIANGDSGLKEEADFFIDVKFTEGLDSLSDKKAVYPVMMMMYYVYYCLLVTIDEILEDFDSPLPTFE